MQEITLRGIQLAFNGKPLFRGLRWNTADSMRWAVMGASGSGKSSLLRVIAGLQMGADGEVILNGETLPRAESRLVPGTPGVHYLSQFPDLMPYWSGEDHWRSGTHGAESTAKRKIGAVKRSLNLRDLDKKLGEFSGGQLQRIALGKALLAEPKVLLLDEVFNQLDVGLRNEVYALMRSWLDHHDPLLLLATHEPRDVFELCDHVMILEKGRLVQYGPLEEVYNNPKSPYVAGLFGHYSLVSPSWDPEGRFPKMKDQVLIRPHQLTLSDSGFKQVEVVSRQFMGDRWLATVRDEGGEEVMCWTEAGSGQIEVGVAYR